MRRVDLHAYPATEPWVRSQDPYPEALAKYWHHAWTPKSEDEVIQDFTTAGVEVIMVAFDIESITGSKPCSNDYVAEMRARYPEQIIQGWAAVDPWKPSALEDARHAIEDLHLLGFHMHPIMGRYAVNDRRLWPLWELIDSLRAPAMIDVGTTGMGAGMAGGHGAIIRHAHPSAIDELAANFPNLTIVAAHPGWPWVDEMTAVALHKGNVYWELSGWAPKYFPEGLKRDVRGRLRDKIMFGSDYPSIPYERLFREWGELGYADEVLEKVFHANAERVLGV
jgi:predicted TIM-barrel fold metal-dependent hydrolase